MIVGCVGNQFLTACGTYVGTPSCNTPVPRSKLYLFSCSGAVAEPISSSLILQMKKIMADVTGLCVSTYSSEKIVPIWF